MFLCKETKSYEIIHQNIRCELLSDVTDDILCLICKRILSNATFGKCGCQYCQECVQSWLEQGNTRCPGTGEDCELNNLKDDGNIIFDFKTQKKLLNLIVRCPNESCSYQCELRRVDEHLRLCDKRPMNCPFCEMGCNFRNASSKSLQRHMNDSLLNHSQILIRTMFEIQNSVTNAQKVGIKLSEPQANEICGETDTFQRNISMEQFTNLENCVKETSLAVETIQYEQNQFKHYLDVINRSLTDRQDETAKSENDFKKEMENLEENIIEFGKKLKSTDELLQQQKLSQEEGMAAMECQLKDLASENENLREKLEECEMKMNDGKSSLTKPGKHAAKARELNNGGELLTVEFMKKIDDKINQRIAGLQEMSSKHEKNLLQLNKQIEGLTYNEFIWKIENFYPKKQKNVTPTVAEFVSKRFFSHDNGYRFCFSVNPNGFVYTANLSVSLAICMGPYDDMLPWPMKKVIRISILHSKGGQKFIEREFQYSKLPENLRMHFIQPTEDKNADFVISDFAKWVDLDKSGICLNKTIIFKCSFAD